MHWEPRGAYTGEVSPEMLLELGVKGTLVGHSERRQLFGESDESVARRARTALDAGLGVIACVGETLEQRESGDTELVLKIQVEAIAFAAGAHENLVIAYEPVWAIGTGKTATPEQAEEAHQFIKGCSNGRCCTAARSSRRTRPSCSRGPRSTVRSSAAPRSSPTPSQRFVARHPARNARRPRRLRAATARPRQRGRARADARVRPALARYPHTTLLASGEAVGLPPGQMGNSEVGHLTIGSGRILFQDLQRVNVAVQDGSFFENEALVAAFARARERGGAVHLLGLVSKGGVHSHLELAGSTRARRPAGDEGTDLDPRLHRRP